MFSWPTLGSRRKDAESKEHHSVCVNAQSCLTLATSWAAAHQGPLSMEFFRQEYWSGLLFPPPRDFLHPGVKPESPALTGWFFTTEPPGKPTEAWKTFLNKPEIEGLRVPWRNWPLSLPSPTLRETGRMMERWGGCSTAGSWQRQDCLGDPGSIQIIARRRSGSSHHWGNALINLLDRFAAGRWNKDSPSF